MYAFAAVVHLVWLISRQITGIMMMFFLLLDVIILDETYPPAFLIAKARRLRYESGNWALHARHEEWDVSVKELGNKFLMTPFRLLATPICFLVALYASFVYRILICTFYSPLLTLIANMIRCLAVISIQFSEDRGWGPVTWQLPFLGFLL